MTRARPTREGSICPAFGPASRFAYTTEILGTESDGPDRHVVTARLTGNFPGSTVVLRHDFTLAGERIARLVIAP